MSDRRRIIYALRPLLACKYIENNHTIPPVRFNDLLLQTLPKELSEETGEMLIIKAESDEQEMSPRLPAIQKYIEDEIERYGKLSKDMADDRMPDWELLNSVFMKVLGRQGIPCRRMPCFV